MLSVSGISQTATIFQVIQKLVQLDEAQTRLKETQESEHTEQKNEMKKLADLVYKTLKEVENQTNTIKGKMIERINDPGPQ